MDNRAWDNIKNNWMMFRGKVRERWGELTDSEITEIKGKRDQLVATIQQKYGIAREEANEQIEKWMKELQLD